VAWGNKTHLPTSYTFKLPKRVDAAGQAAFMASYGDTCTEAMGHQLTGANIWYYYRPNLSGCSIAPDDLSVSPVSVTMSTLNTVKKYPEYHRIWEDGVLDVVAVFGKYDKTGSSASDAGIAAYNEFIAQMLAMFPTAATTPVQLPSAPGVAVPDITFEAEVEAGRVSIVAILVDEVQSASATFDKRFSEATPRADLILYGGHAGLGANVRALTQKAKFFPAKYQLLFLNGCDTFAYEDDTLNATRKLLNPMPAYFHAMAGASAAIIDAMVDADEPHSYEQIFARLDPAQVVLVTGEEDNVFGPSFDPGPRWHGFSKAGSVAYKQTVSYVTEQLAAGRYIFELTPEPSIPFGDADLYLRVGQAPPTSAAYKCPSYKYNSNERCLVTLSQPAAIYLTTMGDKGSMSSPYQLRAWQMLP
jgi:hypothetical protein